MVNSKQFIQEIQGGRPVTNDLLNNKSHVHASGKLAEYKTLLNTCKFKLMAYFKCDKYGREYTVEEKKAGKHRRPIPSNDKVRNVHDEELGLNTLIDYCLQNASGLDAAQIYLIDRVGGYEHMIFKFNSRNIAQSEFRNVEFKKSEYGSTFFSRMLDEPIRTDKIRNL